MHVQSWIDNKILLILKGSGSIDSYINSLKVESHVDDPFLVTIKSTASIFVILPVIITFLRMLYRMLSEKVNYNLFVCKKLNKRKKKLKKG